jgi:hypothetical protein
LEATVAKLPTLNPVMAPDAYCSTCGLAMAIELERGPGGRVEAVLHVCVNAETGCNYQVRSDARLSGQSMPRPAKKE